MQLVAAAIGPWILYRSTAKPASLIELGRALPLQQWPDLRRIDTFLFKFTRDVIEVRGRL